MSKSKSPLPVGVRLGSQATVDLVGAFLIYTGRDSHEESYLNSGRTFAIVTAHEVRDRVIGPGQLVTREAAMEFAQSLIAERVKPALLAPNVLYHGMNCLLWHCPAQTRELWFQAGTGATAKKERKTALNRLSGNLYPQPHLLFDVRGRHFSVFALKGGGRPTEKTKLWRAPYFNVDAEGSLCRGSTNFPAVVSPANAQDYERSFFKSRFTHPTGSGLLAKLPQEALWRKAQKEKRFPESALVPLRGERRQLTVGDLFATFKE